METICNQQTCTLVTRYKNEIKGTNAVRFIRKCEVPSGKTITYANMVCDHRPLKGEKYSVRLTIREDKLLYNDETVSPAADLLETKILLNSTISNAHKGVRFMGIDIKNYFLMTSLPTEKENV